MNQTQQQSSPRKIVNKNSQRQLDGSIPSDSNAEAQNSPQMLIGTLEFRSSSESLQALLQRYRISVTVDEFRRFPERKCDELCKEKCLKQIQWKLEWHNAEEQK